MHQAFVIHSLIPIDQLLRGEAYLNGNWVDGSRRHTVRNPHTDGGLASVRQLSEAQLAAQLDAISLTWQQQSVKQRRVHITEWLQRIRGCQNALALILSQESGCSWQQARDEIRLALEQARVLVAAACESQPSTTLAASATAVQRINSCVQHPFRSALLDSIPLLLAGQTVLLRPPLNTPLSTLALAVIAERVALPAGAFNVAA